MNPQRHWRDAQLGSLLDSARRRFEARVLDRLARHPASPLTLVRLAERRQLGSALLHLLQHLPESGARLGVLAQAAGLRKQSMTAVVNQGVAWGVVDMTPDPQDARAKRIVYTPLGLTWLQAYRDAVAQAQAEFRQAVGDDVATVVLLGLEAYLG